ncbi:hypothetical protein HMPREF1049_1486 [Fusobacterium necrophorum subsp. funduliforme ATCC 51357]|nr:hypothetical protein HMPREF1049_1486 [Fusobacterium necrophorum subsp. funduliforme ATCC 51357]
MLFFQNTSNFKNLFYLKFFTNMTKMLFFLVVKKIDLLIVICEAYFNLCNFKGKKIENKMYLFLFFSTISKKG